MLLEVQKYLKTKSLDDLFNEFGIKYTKFDNLVNLNYSQIDSPKTNQIVMECRGLILEQDTWNIVAMPFRRFFNYGEAQNINKDFDFSKSFALEKIDGSLFQLFNYNNVWYCSSRGCIENDSYVGYSNYKFNELFNLTLNKYINNYNDLNINYNYIFELTSPENKIITPYDINELSLLTIRDKQNEFKELTYNEIIDVNTNYKFRIPKKYYFNTITDLQKISKELPTVEEGYVVINETYDEYNTNWRRIKVKNPSYVALSHIKSSASLKYFILVIYKNEDKEFLSYFPEYTHNFNVLKSEYDKYINQMNQDIQIADFNLDRPEFAKSVKNAINKSIMFALYDKKITSFEDFINNMINTRGDKSTGKYLLSVLKIKDIDFNKNNE